MKILISLLLIATFSYTPISYSGVYDITTGPSKMPDKIVTTHKVKHGEELHLLSAYYQLNPREWRTIYERNNHQIKNPNLIYPDQEFEIKIYEDWKAPYDLNAWLTNNPRW